MFKSILQRIAPLHSEIKQETQLNILIDEKDILQTLQLLKDLDYTYMLDITATDYEVHASTHPTQFAIVYILRHKDFKTSIVIKSYLQGETLPSVTPIFEAADWLEREVYDQYGLIFEGHHNLKRVLNHHEFIGHPLRKSYSITKGQLCYESDSLEDEMKEELKRKKLNEEELMFLNVGPAHPASHGTIRNLLALDGEQIKACVSEIGYLHRGFEKSCENHTYNQIIPYTDRLNYCSAITNNIAFAKVVEEMLDITLPKRAITIRVMLMELARIMDHLVCLAAILVDMGALTNYWYIYNPREKVYDFLSRLTGARLTNSYMRIGGMAHDLHVGWEEELESVLQSVESGIESALSLIAHNRIFHDRTQNVCVISAEDALERYAFTGPNLRASGVAYDMRKDTPYYGYETYDFDVVVGSVGDVYDRIMVRFEEIKQSTSIVRQAAKRMPEGDVCVKDNAITLPKKEMVYTTIEGVMNQFKLTFEGVHVPSQEHYGSLEATNGELGFYIVSDGSGTPYKVKVKAPSFMAMSAYAKSVIDYQLADAVLNLGSFNLIAGEMDR